MKKFFMLCAAVVLATFSAHSQAGCEISNGLDLGTRNAPCSDVPGASQEFFAPSVFEVWRGDLYTWTGVKAGADYTFDICQGTGGTAWDAEFTVVDPNANIIATGTDVGSVCEISFTATVDGAYLIYIHEVGQCNADFFQDDNGVPRLTQTGGDYTCDPAVTDCEAGTEDLSATESPLCPGVTTDYIVNGYTIPTAGDIRVCFTPEPGATGGFNEDGTEFCLFLNGPLPGDVNDTLNLLDGISNNLGFLTPAQSMLGSWTITTVVYDDATALTECDTSPGVTVEFLGPDGPGCVPVTTCEAGTLDVGSVATELCPGVATDFNITGVTIPNSPQAGEFAVLFDPVDGSGSGGPFGGEPDPAFVVTFGSPGAGDENVDVVFTISETLAELLAAPVAPLVGEWTLTAGVFPSDTASSFCDVTASATIDFLTADAVACGGTPECTIPYEGVIDPASVSLTENPNGSVLFEWDPIPGQIGCQVRVRLGDFNNPTQQTNFILAGADRDEFNAPAGQLAALPAFTVIWFQVRCGCQASGPIIASPYTEQVSYTTGLSIAGEDSDLSGKLAYEKSIAEESTGKKAGFALFGQPQELREGTIRRSVRNSAVVSNKMFEVFPNPTEGIVNFDYSADANGMVNVRVFDMVGKAVGDHTVAVNEGRNLIDIDLSAYQAGIYLIEVREGNKTSTSRVMLK